MKIEPCDTKFPWLEREGFEPKLVLVHDHPVSNARGTFGRLGTFLVTDNRSKPDQKLAYNHWLGGWGDVYLVTGFEAHTGTIYGLPIPEEARDDVAASLAWYKLCGPICARWLNIYGTMVNQLTEHMTSSEDLELTKREITHWLETFKHPHVECTTGDHIKQLAPKSKEGLIACCNALDKIVHKRWPRDRPRLVLTQGKLIEGLRDLARPERSMRAEAELFRCLLLTFERAHRLPSTCAAFPICRYARDDWDGMYTTQIAMWMQGALSGPNKMSKQMLTEVMDISLGPMHTWDASLRKVVMATLKPKERQGATERAEAVGEMYDGQFSRVPGGESVQSKNKPAWDVRTHVLIHYLDKMICKAGARYKASITSIAVRKKEKHKAKAALTASAREAIGLLHSEVWSFLTREDNLQTVVTSKGTFFDAVNAQALLWADTAAKDYDLIRKGKGDPFLVQLNGWLNKFAIDFVEWGEPLRARYAAINREIEPQVRLVQRVWRGHRGRVRAALWRERRRIHDEHEYERLRPEREKEAARRAQAEKKREADKRKGEEPLPSHARGTLAAHGKKVGIDRTAVQPNRDAQIKHDEFLDPKQKEHRRQCFEDKQEREAEEAADEREEQRKKAARDQKIWNGSIEAARKAAAAPDKLPLAAWMAAPDKPAAPKPPKPSRTRFGTLKDFAGSASDEGTDDDAQSVSSMATTAVPLPQFTAHAAERKEERVLDDDYEFKWTIKHGPVEHTGVGPDGRPTFTHRGRKGGVDVVTTEDGKVAITNWKAAGRGKNNAEAGSSR